MTSEEPRPADPPYQLSAANDPMEHLSSTSLGIAGLWAVVAVILAIVLLVNAKDAAYGGDAYTGIQNAVMLAVRGIACLLFGSAALGFVVATRRDR